MGGLFTGAGAGLADAKPPKRYKSEFTRKGLHTQPWFLNSFLDLKDDLGAATAAGKRFAIMWELAGCPYCRETHLVNFAKPEISAYIQENYDFLQLDMFGSREVVDFDGKKMSERALAKRHKIRFSPTIQFFAETLEGDTLKNGKKVFEVARIPGYFRPRHFLAMFQFVRDKAYKTGDYRSYLKAKRKKRSG
ncbi:MAG: thioredoxin fold domain-containing protein [Rhodospirillales bacterium]|nr:thioredoxin fold domain-containing protein [Alphaproteobacteria bacterium]MBL6948210.1 thioredoxin fold domain-containing protein [Rhodospirillales bacterium]